MVVYGFVFGDATSSVRRPVERGDLFSLPLYALLILQIFLVPVVNGVLMASAVVPNVVFFGVCVLTRWYLEGYTAAKRWRERKSIRRFDMEGALVGRNG